MNAQEIYKANVGNSHEAAVDAVYTAGFNAGLAAAQAINVDPPSGDLPPAEDPKS